MTSTQQQTYIDTIREFPARLDDLLTTITETDLDSRIAPDEWCTRQIVHHLADSHTRALLLMKSVLFEDMPNLIPWNQAAFAETADYKLPIDISIQIIHGIHQRIVTLLDSLTNTQWQRIGLHPVRGNMTIEDLAELYAWHGGNHIAQINKTLGRTEE